VVKIRYGYCLWKKMLITTYGDRVCDFFKKYKGECLNCEYYIPPEQLELKIIKGGNYKNNEIYKKNKKGVDVY